MNITIIGTGYVGLVTGACLADLGNHVFCLDVAQAKIDLLNSGGVPIYEPGLKEVIERNVEAGRLPVIPAKAGIQSPIPAPTFSVLSNPEFLKEGAAVEDFTRPDRIVLGVDDTRISFMNELANTESTARCQISNRWLEKLAGASSLFFWLGARCPFPQEQILSELRRELTWSHLNP